MVDRQVIYRQTEVTYQMNTTNKSFIDMYNYLRDKGIEQNKFFLILYDKELLGVDPRDPNLNTYMKGRVLLECQRNFWYFLREVIRIPDQGGSVGSGKRYKLHRGNLALNFGFINNWNMFLEMPRQHGKTMSALCWYLWVFLFGTRNSEMMFMNKKHDDSKMNLSRLKDLRDALPSYLQMKNQYGVDGKKLKATSNVETIDNPLNGNKIVTKPAAKNKINANSLGRGCTVPIMYYDEYAFIPYNWIIYSSATPALSTASKNAKLNGAPYGILITTTPGDLTTDEGKDAYETKNAATPFSEYWYTKSLSELDEIFKANKNSRFIYIKYTYPQLGSGEEYFTEMVKDLKRDWVAIRREVLLEWTKSSSNSPFDQNDLDTVQTLIRTPIDQIMLGRGGYIFNIYKKPDFWRYPPIVGVDVSGGYNRDSSAITIIDSETTEVIATFNCNYISITDLGKLIYELIVKYMPNCVVNIERNGGFGASVLSYLLSKPAVKKNLYYEIKDKVVEEKFDGIRNMKRSVRVKSYGFNETRDSRELLMEILRERMMYHKDKFVDRTIYEELCTLEVKRNGKIEHASDSHDDQIFSLLMALYVWYEGKDIATRYNIKKKSIKTDDSLEYEENFDLGGLDEVSISDELEASDDEVVQQQLQYLKSNKVMLQSEFDKKQYMEDQKALETLLQTKLGKKAYCEAYARDPNDFESASTEIPVSVFLGFYDNDGNKKKDPLQEQFDNITNVR